MKQVLAPQSHSGRELLQAYPPQPPIIGFGLKMPLFVCRLRVREGQTRALRNTSTNPIALQNVLETDLSFVSSIRPSRMYGEVIFISEGEQSEIYPKPTTRIDICQKTRLVPLPSLALLDFAYLRCIYILGSSHCMSLMLYTQ